MFIMTSGEFTPTKHFIVDEKGANGVGGWVAYGLRLEGRYFIDQEGARYDPTLMGCPEHAQVVISNENGNTTSMGSQHPGAQAEAPLVNR